MIAAMNGLEVITLFTEDLAAARAFYRAVFTQETLYEDDACSVLRIGNIVINVLKIENAPTLVEPIAVGGPDAGPRALYTVKVGSVDNICRELELLGVRLLNGPIDRPWGRRTAAFADPSGNVWEVAEEIAPGG